MRIQSTDPTTFNAKLNISRIDTPQFKNVAKIFSKLTKKYPNAEMYINYLKDSNNAAIYAYKKITCYDICSAELDSKAWDKLLTYSDSYIAAKLAKLFKLGYNQITNTHEIYKNATQIAKRYGKSKGLLEAREEIMAPARKLIKDGMREEIAKDKVLSTWTIYY